MQYPLGEHEREQIASKTGKKLDEITLDAVMRNQIAPDDIKISKEMLYDRLRKDETIQALVHPAIKYLQALDEKSQGKTQYIHTLKTYLLSGINFSLSAKKLNLHRNTLISRIHKIESLTGIDLNTNASLESLLLSIIIS